MENNKALLLPLICPCKYNNFFHITHVTALIINANLKQTNTLVSSSSSSIVLYKAYEKDSHFNLTIFAA